MLPLLYVRVIRKFLYKVILDRNTIYKRMINIIRIRARKKIRIRNAKIEFDPKKNDTLFITEYKDKVDNYSKGKYVCVSFITF